MGDGYKTLKNFVEKVVSPSIHFIKRQRKRSSTPYKEIEKILKILFHETKYFKTRKGRYKHVFIIHFGRKKFALKIGINKKYVLKDFTTYRRIFKKTGNRYFAKIYWRTGLFMLQKFGEKVKVPHKELNRLRAIGEKFGLTDVREANIMKFNNIFKIVDAERRKKRNIIKKSDLKKV